MGLGALLKGTSAANVEVAESAVPTLTPPTYCFISEQATAGHETRFPNVRLKVYFTS